MTNRNMSSCIMTVRYYDSTDQFGRFFPRNPGDSPLPASRTIYRGNSIQERTLIAGYKDNMIAAEAYISRRTTGASHRMTGVMHKMILDSDIPPYPPSPLPGTLRDKETSDDLEFRSRRPPKDSYTLISLYRV